jgi:hypothetical protein
VETQYSCWLVVLLHSSKLKMEAGLRGAFGPKNQTAAVLCNRRQNSHGAATEEEWPGKTLIPAKQPVQIKGAPSRFLFLDRGSVVHPRDMTWRAKFERPS